MMKAFLTCAALWVAVFLQAACSGIPPQPVASGASEPVSENYRLDLGPDVAVAFVEGLTPGMSEKVAFVTHVPSGSQAILNQEGKVLERHDGRADGPTRLDAVLGDEGQMARITAVLTNGGDASPQPHTITWVPMVRFGGIHYLRRWDLVGKITRADRADLTTDHLGPELYRVAFRLDGYAGPLYNSQDGDATFLNPGTQVYAVKGYAPEFRLATLEGGSPTLYEADTNPSARVGEDLLDIRGKVTAIDILNDDDQMTVLATIDEEPDVRRFVDVVLDAPVNQQNRDHDGPRYLLGLRLADGTSVVRAFWLESGELSRGIMTDPTLTLSVFRAIPKDRLPAATYGEPRISQRLAARLGLAYLSFNVPELIVTGKPHSPTVRLMRRHEFVAMRGGSLGATIPDPLVWVVEAQGSWRTGGIVPEKYRENLSVGVVAFDADTGSAYGSTYRNEPMLERPHAAAGEARSTPPPTPRVLDRESQRAEAIEKRDPALLPICSPDEFASRPDPSPPKSMDSWEHPDQIGCRLPPPGPDQVVPGPPSGSGSKWANPTLTPAR
jgi:hypothetical protein